MLFSNDPKRPKILKGGGVTVGRATLKVNNRVGELQPLVGIVTVNGQDVFGSYGTDWWTVMTNLRAWQAAQPGDAS